MDQHGQPDDEFNYVEEGKIYSEGHAIRLVRLCAGTGPVIQCHLFKAYIHEEGVPYEALSYTWGEPTKTHSIILNDKTFTITKNLYIALQHLRLEHEDRILWIDAICIDQSQNEEKSHQVMHIPAIYREAWRVVFWLGPAELHVNILMRWLVDLQRIANRQRTRDWTLVDSRWKELWQHELGAQMQTHDLVRGLYEILQSPWFSRVWILQECSNARSGIVMCGDYSVSSKIFLLAPALLDVAPDPHCKAVLELMPGFHSEKEATRSLTLFDLLHKFKDCQASEKRDKVFALLSTASDSDRYPEVDYGKSMQQVVEELMLFLFRANFTWQKYISEDNHHNIVAVIDDLRRLNHIAMIEASETGDLDTLRRLSRCSETDYNFVDEHGRSIILAAAGNDCVEIIRHCLSFREDQASACVRQILPGHYDNKDEQDAGRHLQLEREIDWDLLDPTHRSVLQVAIEAHAERVVQTLMGDSQTRYLNRQTEYHSPLLAAAMRQMWQVVDRLLANSVLEVWTVLHHAVETDDSELFCRLFNIVSDIRLQRHDPRYLDELRHYRNFNARRFPMLETRYFPAKQLRHCANRRIVNATNHFGESILLYSIRCGMQGLSNALIANPVCTINAVDVNGEFALSAASYGCRTTTIVALLKRPDISINPSTRNMADKTHTECKNRLLVQCIELGLEGVKILDILMTREDLEMFQPQNNSDSIWHAASRVHYGLMLYVLPPTCQSLHFMNLLQIDLGLATGSFPSYDDVTKALLQKAIERRELVATGALNIFKHCGITLQNGLLWALGDFLNFIHLENFIISHDTGAVRVCLIARLLSPDSIHKGRQLANNLFRDDIVELFDAYARLGEKEDDSLAQEYVIVDETSPEVDFVEVADVFSWMIDSETASREAFVNAFPETIVEASTLNCLVQCEQQPDEIIEAPLESNMFAINF